MPRGQLPVQRNTHNATTVRATNAIHRNASTMTCGMTRTHLTSQSQRLSGSSSSPSTCSGYVDGAACSFMARTPLEPACRRGGSDPVAQDPEVPRTDLLLSLTLLLADGRRRPQACVAKKRASA